MSGFDDSLSRRKFLGAIAAGTAAFTVPGAFAEEILRTPAQTEGPFYPNELPLDTDNDLLLINDTITPAAGEITHLSGRVLDMRGNPVRNAVVHIWQTDHQGIYLHKSSPNRENWDSNFQGFGRFLTNAKGEYYFRTIKPVPYTDRTITRTPHVHFAVETKGRDRFATQCYIRGEKLNAQDRILNAIRDDNVRESVIVDFTPVPGSRIGELAAQFDIVLGYTPEV